MGAVSQAKTRSQKPTMNNANLPQPRFVGCDELLDELVNEQTEEDEQRDYEMIYYERNQPVSETTGQD